jgi:hypothetical protein
MALALIIVVLVLAAAGAILAALRRRHIPAVLRGDWWTSFEREFRAYAGDAANRDRRRRRHRGERT